MALVLSPLVAVLGLSAPVPHHLCCARYMVPATGPFAQSWSLLDNFLKGRSFSLEPVFVNVGNIYVMLQNLYSL